MKLGKKVIILSITLLINIFFITSCNVEYEERSFFAMDTYMTITCYGKDAKEAVEEAVDRINELDKLFSVGIDTSEVNIINKEKNLIASSDMIDIVSRSIDISRKTEGAFDITIKPLVDLWGFDKSELNVPNVDEISILLNAVDIDSIYIEETTSKITIGSEQKIDLGAIAKGYATDEVKKILEDKNITSAYMSLGGNVYCYNYKTNGDKWTIGISNPQSTLDSDCFATVKVANKAVITSGGYQRYLVDEVTQEKYIHILDPYTGYPSKSDILSVTIIATDATLADALSTACFVMGTDKMIEYWKMCEYEFDFVIYNSDDKVYASGGLAEDISCDKDVILVYK